MSTQQESWQIPEFTLGDRMRLTLKARGYSVDAAADVFVCSRQTISNWIGGRRHPSRIALKRWALWTGVPLVWLETGIAPDAAPDKGDAITFSFPRHAVQIQPFRVGFHSLAETGS